MYCSITSDNALVIARRVAFLGVSFIAPLVFAFSTHYLGIYQERKKYVFAAFFIAAVLYVVCVFTPYGIPYVKKQFWGYYPVYSWANYFFLGFFFSYFFAAFCNYFAKLRTTTDPVRKKQLKLITIAFLISFTGSFDYLPKISNYSLYPFGYFCVMVWTMIIAYTIVRYRMMDIQTVVHRTIAWLMTSLLFIAPLVFVLYLTREWAMQMNPVAFLMVTAFVFFLFALYTRHIQPQIDHLFQRRQWDLNRSLEKFNDELVYLKDLNEVRTHILKTVRNIFYVGNISLLVKNVNAKKFDVFNIGQSSNIDHVPSENEFLKWMAHNDIVVVNNYITIDPRLNNVVETAKQYFQKFEAELCVPLVVNEKLIGVINIGQKQNLQQFRSPEIDFLADLRRSAAIAISNAVHLIAMQESLRKWNEELERKVAERTDQLQSTQAQLVQAEKLATIGTLAGGVAHEINNPLTAILTNSQILKMTAEKEDIDSIELIEEGAKRCQSIIQKLMKYARKIPESDTLVSININTIVKNVTNFLMYQLKQDNITLAVQDENNGLEVLGNQNEIEQVLTNLILNAKDAIKQTDRKKGDVTVKVAEAKGTVQISVLDTGVGIKEENISKIFDPFFTTKDVGKGTGLGLAVSHGIVEKHHGRFEVFPNKPVGSIFTVVLPKK